jgi:hypothetical protein
LAGVATRRKASIGEKGQGLTRKDKALQKFVLIVLEAGTSASAKVTSGAAKFSSS